jgi:hypothetical protein
MPMHSASCRPLQQPTATAVDPLHPVYVIVWNLQRKEFMVQGLGFRESTSNHVLLRISSCLKTGNSTDAKCTCEWRQPPRGLR